MGSSIQAVKTNAFRKNNNSLLNLSLSKLCDYHATYKSICDNFSLDLMEFEQIFGANESAFVIWDTDNNGLIDSLELFSGLALFAEAKLEDIVRFLFDLFDINELDSLAAIDVEFMFNCCLSATYKIYSINTEVDNEDLIKFLYDKILKPEARVTVIMLLKAVENSSEIIDYFSVLKKDSTIMWQKQKKTEHQENEKAELESYLKL